MIDLFNSPEKIGDEKMKNRWCKERLTMRRKKQTRSEPIKHDQVQK